jgi:hypothetical protein
MSALPPKADIETQSPDVRFGSKADIARHQLNVRFTPKSGHPAAPLGCALCANSGHLHLAGANSAMRFAGRSARCQTS